MENKDKIKQDSKIAIEIIIKTDNKNKKENEKSIKEMNLND